MNEPSVRKVWDEMQATLQRLDETTRALLRIQNRELALLQAKNKLLRAALRPFAEKAHHDNCTHHECGLRRAAKKALDE